MYWIGMASFGHRGKKKAKSVCQNVKLGKDKRTVLYEPFPTGNYCLIVQN